MLHDVIPAEIGYLPS